MFKILQKTWRTGVVTAGYPDAPADISPSFRGRPAFDLHNWRDARPAAWACPTGAIASEDVRGTRRVTVDYGRCTFCGECAEASGGSIRMTNEFELATLDRRTLVYNAEYSLNPDGTQEALLSALRGDGEGPGVSVMGREVEQEIQRVLGRSLAIREVDAGSCNGCELEITALSNPVWDIERFGIHFVASPRHADALLVTGPVTRNMELALRKTWAATPDPKVVIAAGTCGVSGGIFGVNYATRGGVDAVIPVDVYIPGCPPRPEALLYGILLSIGRLKKEPAEEA